MEFKKVKIVTFVPVIDADKVRLAMGAAGAGQIGEYSYCSFSNLGEGRFIPSNSAHPHIGRSNSAEVVQEERIEVVCNRADAKGIIASMKRAHPYEEVAFDIYPIIDELQL